MTLGLHIPTRTGHYKAPTPDGVITKKVFKEPKIVLSPIETFIMGLEPAAPLPVPVILPPKKTLWQRFKEWAVAKIIEGLRLETVLKERVEAEIGFNLYTLDTRFVAYEERLNKFIAEHEERWKKLETRLNLRGI